jgi:hypothetical protein
MSWLMCGLRSIIFLRTDIHPFLVEQVDTAAVEAINPGMAPLLTLTAPDKKFMDDIIKSVAGTWNSDGAFTCLLYSNNLINEKDDLSLNTHQIEYEGSDEEIRAKFETYLSSLLLSQKHTLETADLQPEPGVRKVDYMSEFGPLFVKAWYNTQNYKRWEAGLRTHVFPESVAYVFFLIISSICKPF